MSILIYALGKSGFHDSICRTQGDVAFIAWSPIRKHALERLGIHANLFSDFSLPPSVGAELSLKYNNSLASFLESISTSPGLKWAPIAMMHVKLRLCRYILLKMCVSSHFESFKPARVIISSQRDPDIIAAIRHCAVENGIDFETRDGEFDELFPLSIFDATPGIPFHLDPGFFFYTRFWLESFIHKKRLLIEPVPHLGLGRMRVKSSLFLLNRTLNLFRSSVIKIQRSFGLVPDTFSTPLPCRLVKGEKQLLTTYAQDSFTPDEQELILELIFGFLQNFSETHLNRVEERIRFYLQKLGTKHIILHSDQTAVGMLICSVAHSLDITVDCLPHGLIMEDNVGTFHKSPFQPDRILAWNHASRSRLVSLGWSVQTASHPAYMRLADSFRVPMHLRSEWRILIMYNDMVGTILGNREDSRILDLTSIHTALTNCGINSRNIFIKIRPVANPKNKYLSTQMTSLSSIQSEFGIAYQIINKKVFSSSDYQEFDLIIFGYTTGIIDAIYAGVPIVIYGPDISRIGLFMSSDLPHASCESELVECILNYPVQQLPSLYKSFIESLREGMHLDRYVSS